MPQPLQAPYPNPRALSPLFRSLLPQERLSLTEPLLATFLGIFCTGVGILPSLDPSRNESMRGVLLELTRLTIVIQVCGRGVCVSPGVWGCALLSSTVLMPVRICTPH